MAPKDSSYTQDVIARGMQAVRERRQGGSRDRTNWQSAYDQMLGGNRYAGGDTGGYDQFAQARGLNPGNYDINYGQTSEGKYAGFKNSSDLWNAVEGKAAFEREQDQLKAQAMEQLINQRMGKIEDMYGDSNVAVQKVGNAQVAGRYDDGGYADLFGGGHGGTDSAGILQGQAANEAAAPDRERLNSWLGTTSDPYMSALETMQQIQQAPITDYEAMAGAQYGVDPNIIRGKYDDQAMLADFRTQRDVQSLQEAGAPYSEVQAALEAAQRQGEDQQQLQQDQIETQMSDEVQGITSIPGTQLAQMADSTVDAVWEAVQSPQYAEVTGALQDELSKGDQADQATIDDILSTIQFADPTLYRIITAQFNTGG